MNFMSQTLGKSPENIRRKDILNYIKNNGIQILNLCYISSDSKLKTVSFPTTDLSYINAVLSTGVRIASVFLHKSLPPENSYIVPKYRHAFPNPFSLKPTLNILCSSFNKDQQPCSAAPATVLTKASAKFTEKTSLTLTAAGELEYFVLYPDTYDLFRTSLKNYQASSPFALWENMRNEILHTIASLNIPVKYAHTESGKTAYAESSSAEQHEIEFLPAPISEAADNIVISKWVVCNIAKKYGVSVTFAPVIEYGKIGNGLHFHLGLIKKKRNIVLDPKGNLSIEAQKTIGGILKLARSLCAFGNPSPLSYLRLMGKEQSPYGICWGERSRKTLIRIPIGGRIGNQMARATNPDEKRFPSVSGSESSIEFRAADGTATIHLILAGLAVAATNGFQDKSSLQVTKKLHVTEKELVKKKLAALPQSCRASAEDLEKNRKYYEKDGIFPPALIDSVILELKSHQHENVLRHPSKNKGKLKHLIKELISYYPYSKT